MDYSNIILFQLIVNLLEKIKLIVISDYAKYYLQGIFAGEASVKRTTFGSLDNVNVGAVRYDEQKLFADCLTFLGINSSHEKNCIRIHNLKNFLKIYRNQLLILHPVRYNKFLKYLLGYRQIPKELKVDYSSLIKEVENDAPYNVV